MSILKKIVRWLKMLFKWHLYPKESDLSLKSFYEVLFYIIVTASLTAIFYLWNKVPERNLVIHIDKLTTDTISNDSAVSVDATFILNIPSTNREIPDSLNAANILKFEEERVPIQRKDSIVHPQQVGGNLNFLTRKFYKKIFETSNLMLLSEFYKDNPNFKSRKVAFFSLQYNTDLNSIPSRNKVFYSKVIEESGDTTHLFDYQEGSSDSYYLKEFIAGDSYNFNYLTNITSTILGRPKWYRFEDISQSYFNIRLYTREIDSLRLKINFGTAADFSNMDPEPDVVGMGNIEFYDPAKLYKIEKEGLQFHVKFRELENMQTVRMLGVTSILGGIIILFVAIMFVAFYKFFSWFRYHVLWGTIIVLILLFIIVYWSGLILYFID